MTAVKKLQGSTRTKRTPSAGRRTKNTRKHSKRIRFAPTTDGPGSPTDGTGAK